MLVLDEIRLSRDALRYGFAVGKVNVLETRTLDRAAYERLLDAPTFAEQKRLLSETPYGRHLESAETTADVERALDAALEEFYGFLETAALPDPVTRFFRLPYDFANVKAVAKGQLLGVPVDDLLVDHGTVARESFTEETPDIPQPLAELLAKTLERADEIGGERADETRDAEVDRLVDQAMFTELAGTAKKSKSRFLGDVARSAIDLANVKTLVRAARNGMSAEQVEPLLAAGGSVSPGDLAPAVQQGADAVAGHLARFQSLKSLAGMPLSDLASLDASLGAARAAVLRRGRAGQVGPEPVIAYVLGREAEVATLRVLLIGRLTGIDDATLRRHAGNQG